MSTGTHQTVLGGAVLASLSAVVVALAAGGAPAGAADQGPAARAEGLASAAAVGAFSVARQFAPGPDARAHAALRAGRVPLPPGQAFDDINWDNGTLSEADIDALLEFNAACRWWIAGADAPTPQTARVIAAIPQWPTMRGGDRHRAAAAFVAPGDPVLAGQLLAYCRAERG